MLQRLNLSMRQVMRQLILLAIAFATAFAVAIVSTFITAEPGMAVSHPTQVFSGEDLSLPHAVPTTSLTHQEPNFY
jgi:hypothetical protein